MIKYMAPLCGLALALYGTSQAQACSTDEAAARAQELAAKVEEITQRDPERAALLREQLRQAPPQTAGEQAGSECEAYDERLRELEAIGGEVEEQVQEEQVE